MKTKLFALTGKLKSIFMSLFHKAPLFMGILIGYVFKPEISFVAKLILAAFKMAVKHF